MRSVNRRRWGWTFAFAALSMVVSANFGTSAWAQAQRSDEPAEPAHAAFTGDWGGLRHYLERKGLIFTLAYTNDFLSNVRGGIRAGTVVIGVFQPQLDIDLQKLVGWEGGHFHTPMVSLPMALSSVRLTSATFWRSRISKPDRSRGFIRFGMSRAPWMAAFPCASV
jgi:hypothetical protein